MARFSKVFATCPAPVAASVLMEARVGPRESLQRLSVGDAITFDGIDYLVQSEAANFSDGRTWRLAHLLPSGGDATERWLWIAPGAAELAWLESLPAVSPGAERILVEQQVLPLVDSRSGVVDISSSTGRASGGLVTTWTYRSGPLLGLVEQWPDGAVRTYGGRVVDARQVEVWPSLHALPARV